MSEAILTNFELEFARDDFRWQIYRNFIKIAFQRGHKTKNQIQKFVERRIGHKCKNLFEIEDWSLGNVAEYFLVYGCYMNLRNEGNTIYIEILRYADLQPAETKEE